MTAYLMTKAQRAMLERIKDAGHRGLQAPIVMGYGRIAALGAWARTINALERRGLVVVSASRNRAWLR